MFGLEHDLPLDLGESAILSVTDNSRDGPVMELACAFDARLAGQYCSLSEIEGSIRNPDKSRQGDPRVLSPPRIIRTDRYWV
jgi:hypothetical protein